MNILERVASDMADAGIEARHAHENETDACLEILDEFIAGHEVVDVVVGPKSGDYYVDFGGRGTWERVTIIVPRAEPPSLLAAAEGASATWHKAVLTTPAMTDAMLALDTAIKRARESDEQDA